MDSAQTAPITPQTPQPRQAQQNVRGHGQQQAPAQIQKTAKEFESFFVFQMLEHMSEGIEAPDVYGGGSAENMFRSMLNEKMAAEVSQSSNMGIAEAVEKQIQRYQDNANRR